MIPEEHWTNSPWSCDDLHNKTVDFRIATPSGIACGIGGFIIYGTGNRLVVIVRVEQPGSEQTRRLVIEYTLFQPLVERIERHPDPSVADFRVHQDLN